MSRTRKSSASHTSPSKGTAIAPVTPALPTITRSEANRLLKERAQERFHNARAERDERIRHFEGEFGRADRIDAALLKDLQHLQVRFAAIAARQHRHGSSTEPKVSKYTKQLGDVIGELSAHLATERALELFAPVEQHEYVGVGSTIGRKGLDESVLDGYTVVDDPTGPKNAAPTIDEDDEQVCLHEDVQPSEDDPTRGFCEDCGEEFGLDDAGAKAA